MKRIAKVLLVFGIIAGIAIPSYYLYQIYFSDGEGGLEIGNQGPSISKLPDVTLNEDSTKLNAINLTKYSNDTDNDALSYTIKGNTNAEKCNVSINKDNMIDIEPCANWNGFVDVIVEVSDGSLKANDTFRVIVNSVNDLPVLSNLNPSVKNKSIQELSSTTYSLSASDVEQDPITYTWYVDDYIVGGNHSSYTVSTNYKSSGSYKVKVNVSDGKDEVIHKWNLKVNDTGPVVVYVNSSLFNLISSEIKQYKQDLIDQGFQVIMFNWTAGNATRLRNNITYYYNNQGLIGAVLIGNMSYILGRYFEGFPHNRYYDYTFDLYLMDLNGTWNNLNGDNKVDYPNEWVGDEKTEIFISRINPTPLLNQNHLNAIKQYFHRNHDYRTGVLKRPHSGLLYVDDTWSQLTGWDTNFTAYTNFTFITKKALTNRTDYLNRLTQFYEWVHPMIHSWPYEHQLDMPVPFPSPEKVFPIDILTTDTKALFFNLYCCFNCNYTYTDNLGTKYLFSNNTLTVLGSSRSGGMDLYQPFYDSLKAKEIIGSAFKDWFYNPEIDQYNKRPNVSGMTILGDPMLTIHM